MGPGRQGADTSSEPNLVSTKVPERSARKDAAGDEELVSATNELLERFQPGCIPSDAISKASVGALSGSEHSPLAAKLRRISTGLRCSGTLESRMATSMRTSLGEGLQGNHVCQQASGLLVVDMKLAHVEVNVKHTWKSSKMGDGIKAPDFAGGRVLDSELETTAKAFSNDF